MIQEHDLVRHVSIRPPYDVMREGGFLLEAAIGFAPT